MANFSQSASASRAAETARASLSPPFAESSAARWALAVLSVRASPAKPYALFPMRGFTTDDDELPDFFYQEPLAPTMKMARHHAATVNEIRDRWLAN